MGLFVPEIFSIHGSVGGCRVPGLRYLAFQCLKIWTVCRVRAVAQVLQRKAKHMVFKTPKPGSTKAETVQPNSVWTMKGAQNTAWSHIM